MSQESILPIVSGGLDSTVMLYFLKQQGYAITEILSFNYGQKHKKETLYAEAIAAEFKEKYSVSQLKHTIVDISNIGDLISSGAITGDEALPTEMYDDESQRVTVVPNRNMIFLSIAAGRAITIKAKNIGYAAHASDYSVYPDCRPEFISALDKALIEGNLWDPVHLIAPFQHKTKSEIVRIGIDLGVPMKLTWSCYAGEDRPCLSCGTCLERTEAFITNDIQDPALSDSEWRIALTKYDNIKNHTSP